MSLVWEVHWPTQSQLLVALKLADHAHNDGSSVYPAKASIARQAQCSESTVQNALRAFRACGLLRVVQEGGAGPRSPTIYAINVELLEGLAAIQAKLEGEADSIEIPETVFENALNAKGSTVDPLGNVRGQSDTAKGSTETAKGSIALTPNHHLRTTTIEPSGAKVSKFDFGSEGRVQPTHKPSFTITPRESNWKDWVGYLQKIGNFELAEKALTASAMRCTSRYPREGSELPVLVFSAGLTDKSKRMAGDAA